MENEAGETTNSDPDPHKLSGKWSGYWLAGYDKQEPTEMTLEFRGGTVAGFGWDCAGPFRVMGWYATEERQLRYHKLYAGHTVRCEGYVDEDRAAQGNWRVGGLGSRFYLNWVGPAYEEPAPDGSTARPPEAS